MTRLHGICERAASPEQPLGPDVVVPESVPVSIIFSYDHIIGVATLRRDEHGDIWADIADVQTDPRMLEACPCFAIRAIVKPGQPAVINGLAICEANVDPDLPPYEVSP